MREGEQAFDRVNPDYGLPADQRSRYGRQAVRDRRPPSPSASARPSTTAARTTPNPVMWQAGQDYRMADALQAARHQPTRSRWGPERLGPER